jgi:hypothetical protein
MTSETDKQIPAASGKDQRPHATLDLTATEVFPEGGSAQGETQDTAAKPGGATERLSGPASPPRNDDGAAPPPNGARGGGGFFTHMAAGLMGAALALILAFYVFGAFREHVTKETNRVAEDLRQLLAASEQRMAALESSIQTGKNGAGYIDARLKAAGSQTGALKQEIAALDTRVKSLENAPAPAGMTSLESLQPLNAKLADLENRVANLAKAQDRLRSSTGSAALAMAVQNLRRAVGDGKPFATELKTLTALASEPLDVAALEPRRDNGLASIAQLQRDFDSFAKTAIEASRTPGDGSFAGDLLAKARGLVRMRPTGDIPGNAPEAILARAEQRLDGGDLPAAIRESSQLSGPAAGAMAPWLLEAKARAAADETLARIEAKLMTSLSLDERAKRGG